MLFGVNVNLNLSMNKPEAGRLMVTLMRLRKKLMITGGGRVMMIIKGRVTLTIDIVKMLHAFFEERGRLYTPLTMMLMMMMMMIVMITR